MSCDFWRDRPVLVTGATGLVGGWLTRRLLDAGADVVCLVRDWVPQSELVRIRHAGRVKVVRGDMRDRELVERAIGEYEIDTVFHLAAQTIVGIANRNPISTFESNIQGTWNAAGSLPPLARGPIDRGGLFRQGVWRAGRSCPTRKTRPLQGRHPYDVSKSCADLIAQSYAKTYELPVAITRCGNFYGGGDLNWNRIVPGTIRFGAARRAAGDPLRRPVRPRLLLRGRRRRGLHAAGRAAALPMPELRGKAFNFSNEIQVTVLELVNGFCGHGIGAGARGAQRGHQRNPPPVSERRTRAHACSNWAPLFTLEEGLERTIAWYREFLA